MHTKIARLLLLIAAAAACGDDVTTDTEFEPGRLDFIEPTYDGADAPRVLFAVGHGESYEPDSGIAAWLGADGYDVDPLVAVFPSECPPGSASCDTPYWLEVFEARAVAIINPTSAISDDEIAGLLDNYVAFGGALLVATEDPALASQILSRLAIGTSVDVIEDACDGCAIAREGAGLNVAHPALEGAFAFDPAIERLSTATSHGMLSPDDPAIPDDIYPDGLYKPVVSLPDASIQSLTVEYGLGRVFLSMETSVFRDGDVTIDIDRDAVHFALNMTHWLEQGTPAVIGPDPFGPGGGGGGQQAAEFDPEIANPEYTTGGGPLIMIDEFHRNFHTSTGRYRPVADTLRADGYQVQAANESFDTLFVNNPNLEILVMANTQQNANLETLTATERAALLDWVEAGGSLFFIVDHAPFHGNPLLAADLGLEFLIERNGPQFGVRLHVSNCVPWFTPAQCTINQIRFNADGALRWEGTLDASHPIIAGRNEAESVGHVLTYTGTGISIVGGATRAVTHAPIAQLPAQDAFYIDPTNVLQPANGLYQGVAVTLGTGRIYVAGEAAEFTAQRAGSFTFGLQDPNAEFNMEYLLNVVHWLDGNM